MVFNPFDEGTPCEGKAATKSSLPNKPCWLPPLGFVQGFQRDLPPARRKNRRKRGSEFPVAVLFASARATGYPRHSAGPAFSASFGSDSKRFEKNSGAVVEAAHEPSSRRLEIF